VSLSWYRHTQLVFSGGLAPLAAQRVDGTGTEQQGGPPLGAGDGLALTTCLQSALWRTWRHKWIETVQSIIITGSRQQAGRQEGLGVWGLRMHVGSALRPRSEARSVPPLPKGIQKKNLLA